MDNNSEPEYDSEAEWSIGTGSVTDSDAFGQDWSSDEEFLVPEFGNEDPPVTPVSDVPQPNGSGTLGRLLYDNRVPLDIALETLQYLKPGELVALARTCKQIRSLLLSGQLTPVWKASRAMYGIPPPPPERSEIAWAQFLFGRKMCHHCELAMAKVPDWQLMCRLCSECKRLNLVNARAVKYEFKDHHPDLTKMVLYTNVRKRYARSETAYYWREDLEMMGKIIKAHEADIAAGKPGAQEVFEAFKESRIAFVEAVTKHVPVCIKWAAKYNESRMDERAAEKNAWRTARMNIIEQRLLTLGHRLDDIRWVLSAGRLTDLDLAERSWQTTLRDLVCRTKHVRKRRLDGSHGPLIEERKRALKEAYAAKRKSVSPREWRSITFLALPPPPTLLHIPLVLDFVYSDVEQNLGVAEFRTFLESEFSLGCGPAQATAQYNRLMSAGAHAVVSTYPSFLTGIGERALLDCALLTYVDSDNDTAQPPWYPNDCTDLSTILCRRFFGAGIGLPDRSLEYCPRRAQAVASILELLHLPATTTVAELDARDARFDCMICRPGRIRGGGWQKRAHRWRSAVIHHALDHQRPWQMKSDPPRYVLLSDEKAAEARVKEGNPIDLASIATWFCAHCGEHLENWKPYADVEKHVKDAHGVLSPQREDDILYMPMVKIHPEAVMISCDPLPEQVVNCRCLLCPANGKKKTKVFSEEGVRCHLSTTHRPLKLEDGAEGVHFTRSA
ncbi:uncharacterized protein SCHCODRAFT_02629519 [Schizophyllum commune H4-8]|nr:uncharacterized protein SCHCODRAFT_02629519 [Schizophyllum commune H4-8]KAI5891587.1 hypothetical protein SCHCODRAFT_02629519 [Schizophyllum commune H4-8]